MRNPLSLLLCLLCAGCATYEATMFPLPKERAAECVAHCTTLDMRLAAVVIIKSSAGCVCEPKESTRSAAVSGAAAVAGGAMIAAEEESAAR